MGYYRKYGRKRNKEQQDQGEPLASQIPTHKCPTWKCKGKEIRIKS
jgi:hypothetical protein